MLCAKQIQNSFVGFRHKSVPKPIPNLEYFSLIFYSVAESLVSEP
jgi:hypothetical protein